MLLVFAQSACSQDHHRAPGELPQQLQQSESEVGNRIPPDSIVPVEAGYFRPPLDISINIGGSFGELRPNHFHAGIDIRTEGHEGLTVRSCADGFVSRIKVSPYGYGNALYIDHPNGYSTVYAHMKEFAEPIASYVKSIQYENESFEVDIYPEDSLFQVTKGLKVGLSGNTGRSSAPHLHFEIRETGSEWPVNPLLLTNWVKDNIPPVITRLWQYSVPMVRGIGRGSSLPVVAVGKSVYRIAGDTLQVNIPEILLGLEVSDRHDGNSGKNDINSLELWVDGEQRYGWNLRKFSFDDSRCINAHIDYGHKHERGVNIHRLYKAPGDDMPSHTHEGSGIIALNGTMLREVVVRVRDAHDNLSVLKFWVMGVSNPLMWAPHTDTLPFHELHNLRTDNITMTFEPFTFFDTVSTTSLLSDDNCLMPLRKPFQVATAGDRVDERLRDKAILVRHDLHSRSKQALSSRWEADLLVASSTQMGRFEIDYDTTAPTISPVNHPASKNFTGRSTINLRIKDDLSGIAAYDSYIDGKWVLPVYDAKNNLITHRFEQTLAPGRHEFKLVVKDAVGNVAESVFEFAR